VIGLSRIFKLLLGYGTSEGGVSRVLKPIQTRLYHWALKHPVFSFKAFHFFLAPFLKETAMVQGHRMHLDKGDSMGLSFFGVFEPFMSSIVAGEVRRGDIVLDIGASIGYYTLMFARLVGEEGHVYAFEPAPESFEILKRNIEENGYRNVTLINKAVSDFTGKTRLFLCGYNNMAHTMSKTRSSSGSIEIDTVRLDDFFGADSRPIDFIKIDVEGAELAAIRGMERLLQRSPSVSLITEFYPGWLASYGADAREYLKFLTGLGFSVSDINEEVKRVESSDPEAICDRYIGGDIPWTNLLCKKNKSC
jgi:FkbM family methyltransferase